MAETTPMRIRENDPFSEEMFEELVNLCGDFERRGIFLRAVCRRATASEFWVRNLARKATSFRLQTSTDWFYPDSNPARLFGVDGHVVLCVEAAKRGYQVTIRKSALRCSGLGLALLLHCLTPPSRALACVVGTGTGATCTQSALNACLPGGGSFDGTVTFNCGGAATITVTSTKNIGAGTHHH
jgi:hypothetical protein